MAVRIPCPRERPAPAIRRTHKRLPLVGAALRNAEGFAGCFCSEPVAAGLEAGGAIERLNASEVTPIDLCMFRIYGEEYHQLKGDARPIRGFNTLAPTGWGL